MAGGGLIVAGVAVLFLGFIFLSFAIESEEDASQACDAANVGDEAGNETCDSKDRKFIGLQSTVFILAIMVTGIALIVVGVRKTLN